MDTPDYESCVKWLIAKVGSMPHCDSLVLHRPEDCKFCAMPAYQDLHKYRLIHKISYTGETNGQWPCPSEQRRKLSVIHSWGGNRPKL